MRGGFIHNRVLLDPIEAFFNDRGETVYREYHVRIGLGQGFVDLWVPRWRISCEAETSPRRVDRDIIKAGALDAHGLLIVTPQQRIARACARRFRPDLVPASLRVYFLTLGAAREWLANCFPLLTQANDFQKSNH